MGIWAIVWILQKKKLRLSFSILKVRMWVKVYKTTPHGIFISTPQCQLKFDNTIQRMSSYSVNQFLNVSSKLNTGLVIRIRIQLWTRDECLCLWGEGSVSLLITLSPGVQLPSVILSFKELYNWYTGSLFLRSHGNVWECLYWKETIFLRLCWITVFRRILLYIIT